MTQPLKEISAQGFAERQAIATELEQPIQLIDVREPHEVVIVALEGFKVLPLSQFEQWSPTITQDFDPQAETYVLCHHGVRSAQMSQWLLQQGFSNVINIDGGIHSYALTVDPTLPRY